MTISHHPPEDLLADFAAGRLEEAHQLVVGVHVAGCARCGRFVQAIEQLGGLALEDVEPVPVASDAFEQVMSRIHDAPEERAARIAAAIKQLSAEQSTVVRLSFIEERPHPEIASALGIPLGTVKSRIRLAMNRLRDILDEEA